MIGRFWDGSALGISHFVPALLVGRWCGKLRVQSRRGPEAYVHDGEMGGAG